MELNKDQRLRVKRIFSFITNIQQLGIAMEEKAALPVIGYLIKGMANALWVEMEGLLGMTWEKVYNRDGEPVAHDQ